MVRVVVAVPAFNEERFLENVLLDILQYVDKKDVLVIDDGSTDRTLDIIHRVGVESICHNINRGKGAALIAAYRYAIRNRYDWIITLDGDGQHPPSFIPDFLKEIGSNSHADVILGNRSDRFVNMPFPRILSNGITSVILSLCSGGPLFHDSQCGFRAIRVSSLKPGWYKNKGFQLESEMLIKLGRSGKRFSEISISTVYGAQKSSIRAVSDTLKFIKLIFISFFW